MDRLSPLAGLVISQQKEWGEILTGFETRNKYLVSDTEGNRLYLAAEEAGSLLLRLLLKARRPFTIRVFTGDQQEVLRVRRPFRFYFHQAEVLDSQGQSLGVIEKRFSLVRRVYAVTDERGQEIAQLFGTLLRPWTFQIRSDGQTHGKIAKKWSGLLKEGFSDADNFGVQFPATWDVRRKALFLGAVFLIDFVHFENRG
jgi:uncharacterized protein YxjI